MKAKEKLVSKGNTDKGFTMWVVVMFIFFALMFLNFYMVAQRSEESRVYSEYASELRVLSQRIAKNSTESASGNEDAFGLLQKARSEFAQNWTLIKDGDPVNNLEGSPGIAAEEISRVSKLWGNVSSNAKIILEGEGTVLDLHAVARKVNETIPQLQLEYNDVVEILIQSKASSTQIAKAQEQVWIAERIARSVNNVLAGGEEAVMAADNFGRDAQRFGKVLNGMIKGDRSLGIRPVRNSEALVYLKETNELFQIVNQNADQILKTSPEVFRVKNAADSIFLDSGQLLKETTALAQKLGDIAEEGVFSNLMGVVFAILAILSSVKIGTNLIKDASRRHEEAEEENEKNQKAILRLLDEIASLGDGDLTIVATVTEDFTGAIADSINFAIDQMRGLVLSINETAVQVSGAGRDAEATAMHPT